MIKVDLLAACILAKAEQNWSINNNMEQNICNRAKNTEEKEHANPPANGKQKIAALANKAREINRKAIRTNEEQT